MKNNSFEKTERAKHRKKQKNTKIPKLIFTKSILSCYGRLKVIRSLFEANLHHVNDKIEKNS